MRQVGSHSSQSKSYGGGGDVVNTLPVCVCLPMVTFWSKCLYVFRMYFFRATAPVYTSYKADLKLEFGLVASLKWISRAFLLFKYVLICVIDSHLLQHLPDQKLPRKLSSFELWSPWWIITTLTQLQPRPIWWVQEDDTTWIGKRKGHSYIFSWT